MACHGCGRRLPLRINEPNEEAALWECVECQTSMTGVIAPEIVRMLSRRMRLAARHFDVENAEPLTDAVLRVVWQSAFPGQHVAQHCGRRSQRISGQREVLALRLDERFRLTGRALNGVVANLSRHGQMLVTTTQLDMAPVITQFQNASRQIQLIGRVVWSRYLDVGCYGAGVDFIARFGRID
jgi:hypothetical protein